MKLEWAAPTRNKGPILEVLERVLPARGLVLEIGSGTGQHAVHFARSLPGIGWQPSDIDPTNCNSIRAWVADARLPNLRAPLVLDVRAADWGVGTVSAIMSANMVHIAPWECAIGLFEGAARHLEADGALVLYGPFSIGGRHTAESNARFDASLRAQDDAWGVRDLDAIDELGAGVGLERAERIDMPANNQTLVFRRA